MKAKRFCAMLGLAAALLSPGLAAALPFTFTFGTLPSSGMVSGQPGQLVGWGYSLSNTDSVNWFVPTLLSASSSSLGTLDASYFDFPILAPGISASQAFDDVLVRGLYGLHLFNTALPGQSESGNFALSGEWWSGDPLAGGVFLQTSDQLLSPFTVQIVPGAVPVPGSLALLAPGLMLLWRGWSKRRGKKGFQVGASLA
ncbi:hypothetical protein [Pseudoduganella violacea]|uniref:PEP-CTERM sorting domain-containing protein n=1 Tax=Pseudoduganella violacea TaxID=1715466 RepID=A0A7W5FVL7_9BURK|nr:hypothetical protein [Pseudoduganella violacea]MBB3121130.1 hypothetical protein [Pseudoduganella violacea]